MEYFKKWVQTLLYLNLFIFLCQGLLKKTGYEKYIRLITGFLIMMSLLKPLIDLSNHREFLDGNFLKNAIRGELASLDQEGSLEEMHRDIQQEYESAYEEQIRLLTDDCGLVLREVEISWDQDSYVMKKCKILLEALEDGSRESKITDLKRKLNEVYNLGMHNIDIETEG